MRRIVCALAAAVVLAACGGTDWNSRSDAVAKAARAAKAAKAAKVAAAAERPYIDAMMVSAHAEMMSDSGPMPTTTQVRCLATAVVHSYGKAGFARAGITLAELRKSGSGIDGLAAPTPAQVTRLGSAIQHCRIGKLFAAGLVRELNVTNATATTCLGRRVDTDAQARRFLALSALGRPADLAAAHSLVGVMAACLDLPALVIDAAQLHVDAATHDCLVNALRNSEPELKDFLAQTMADHKAPSDEFMGTLGVAMNGCRPGVRDGFGASAD